MKRRVITAAIVLVASGVGCASLLGVDDFEPVDCAGDCGGGQDGGGPTSGDANPAVDARAEAASTVDASPCPGLEVPCTTGSRVVVTFVSPPDGGNVTSDPSGIDVAPGATGSACFGSGRLRLYAYAGSGLADYDGVSCEDGNRNAERCELSVVAPACVVVTRR